MLVTMASRVRQTARQEVDTMRTQHRILTRLAPLAIVVSTVACGSGDDKVQQQPASTESVASPSEPAQSVTSDPELDSVDEDLASLDSDLQVIDDALAELDTIAP